MNEAIQQLIKNIETKKRSINKIRSKQLNNALTKDDVRSFVFKSKVTARDRCRVSGRGYENQRLRVTGINRFVRNQVMKKELAIEQAALDWFKESVYCIVY